MINVKIAFVENVNLENQLAFSSRLLAMSNYFLKQGDEVTIVCSSPTQKKGKMKIVGTKTDTYSLLGNLKFVSYSASMINQINNFDIIHTFQPNLTANMATWLSRIKKNNKTKIINDIRSLWIEMLLARFKIKKYLGKVIQRGLYNFEKLFMNYADFHFFITKEHQQYYETMMNNHYENSAVIPNTMHLKPVERKNNERFGSKLIFGYIGSLQKKRDLNDFYRVFSKIDDIELQLYGLPRPTYLPKNVTYMGHVPYHQIPTVLSTFDVGTIYMHKGTTAWFDLVTNMAGYPRKILEYLGAGLPILASDQKINRVATKNNAVFYDPNDVDDIKEKINLMKENKDLRNNLSTKGKEIFKNSYDINTVGKRIRNIYSKLINEY